MTDPLEVTTTAPQETQELGRHLGALVQERDLLLLSGSLGTGKTTMTQGIAWGMGVREYAHSPTFVLVHEHRGRLPLFHVDLYRLDDPQEIDELGLDEYLAEGVCVVEWAEKALALVPEEHLLIELAEVGPTRRLVRMRPRGERYGRLLAALRARLGAT